MFGSEDRTVPIVVTQNLDAEEARLEAREVNQYLLAKSFFDCREYDRCAALFWPRDLPTAPILNSSSTPAAAKSRTTPTRPSKPTATPPSRKKGTRPGMPKEKPPVLSQKSLFLSLYAKFMAGEKRKDEESEMILGPQDGGTTMNREIGGIIAVLSEWFSDRESGQNGTAESQGWLEYL